MVLNAELNHDVDQQIQEILDIAARELAAALVLLDEQYELLERQLGTRRVHARDRSRMPRIDVAQIIECLLGAQFGEQDAVAASFAGGLEQLLRPDARKALIVFRVENRRT